MSKLSSHKKLAIRSGLICNSPEELLRSRKFAQFLCFFNRARFMKSADDTLNRSSLKDGIKRLQGLLNIFNNVDPDNPEKKKIEKTLAEMQAQLGEAYEAKGFTFVTPEDVALNGDLAEEVFQFYRNSDITILGDETDIRRMEELIDETRIFIHEGLAAPKLPDEELTETPDWILAVFPDCEKKLPARIVREMEYMYQRNWLSANKTHPKNVNEEVIADMMNNFASNYVVKRESTIKLYKSIGRKLKDRINKRGEGEERSRYMLSKTWEQFFAEIDGVMEECGLSAEDIKEKSCSEASLYLFPAFLELLKRGYKIYPDLSI